MSSKPAPRSPASPVSTEQNRQTYQDASSNIGQVANNQLPMQAYNFFAPGMMSMTPYGFDPTQMATASMSAAQQGQNMFNAGNNVMNMAFDPQNALYDRTAQRLQDQTRASQASRGIQTTPYGAGLENQAMSDFNIDWENNLLNRATSGVQAGSTAYGSGMNTMQGGYGMASLVPQLMQTYLGNMQSMGMNTNAPQMWAAPQYSNLFGAGTQAQQNAYNQNLQRFNTDQANESSSSAGYGQLAASAAMMALMFM